MSEIEKQLNSLVEKNSLPQGILLSSKDSEVIKQLAFRLARQILKVERPETHPDFIHINTYQVEDIRRFLDVLSLKSFGSRVIILENAEQLTVQAVNNMLKKIEEPSEKTTFIVLTSHEEKLLPTLRSRLMAFSLDSKQLEMVSDLADQFLKSDLLEQRLRMLKEVDPHEEDLNLFLKQIYKNEIENLSDKSGQRLTAVLRMFELLAANVQANRALAWLAIKWS